MDFAHHTSLAIASRDGAGLLEEFDSDNDGSLSLEEHLKAYDSDVEDSWAHFCQNFVKNWIWMGGCYLIA